MVIGLLLEHDHYLHVKPQFPADEAGLAAAAFTYNVKTLASEGSLEVLFEELEGVKWDIRDLDEVRRTGEEFIDLKNGHTFSIHEEIFLK